MKQNGFESLIRFPRTYQLAGAIAVLSLAACGPARPPTAPWDLDPAAVSGARALEECAALVRIGPRDAGTPGAQRAAEHIAAQLRARGYAPDIEAFHEAAPGGDTTFRNVLARRAGPGPVRRIILLGAHYDTKSGIANFEGANDACSGAGALLEVARVLADAPPPPSGVEIRFAFFDGEECRVSYGPRDGLHGSRHVAAQALREGWARQVAGVIILDMVGDRDWNIALPSNVTPSLAQLLFRAAEEERVRDRVSWSSKVILDDHTPFFEAGMPALNLMDFEYGSAPGLNDYWHTPEDRMEHISAESLATSAKLALRVVRKLAEGAARKESDPHP